MKKLILLAAFAVTTSIASAQVSFGVQLGANIAMGKATFDGVNPLYTTSIGNDPKVGIMGGFVAEIPVGGKLAFRPELNFIQKGSKTNATFASFGISDVDNHKLTLNYIEVPLNVVYKLDLGAGNLFFGLGPTVAIGISGKDKVSNDAYPGDPDYNYTNKVNFDGKKSDEVANSTPAEQDAYYKETHLKRIDIGANIIAGYKLPMGLFAKLGYTYNFMDIDPNKKNADPDDRSSYKNRGFSICVGYMIGGSKSAKKKD